MSRIMFDSTSARDIPTTVDMVAGYVDGAYAWSQADWDRFPNVPHVRIVVHATTNDGDVLDVEQGDATPAQAAGWVRMRQAAGLVRPTIYCPLTMVPAVQAACQGLAYDLWVAHYTGQPHSEPGAVATQYADPPSSGGHYDLSLVVDDAWPHRQGDDMTLDQAKQLDAVFGFLFDPNRSGVPGETGANLIVDIWNRTKNIENDEGAEIPALQAIKDRLDAMQAGGQTIDYAAIAKAVDDEIAKRMQA